MVPMVFLLQRLAYCSPNGVPITEVGLLWSRGCPYYRGWLTVVPMVSLVQRLAYCSPNGVPITEVGLLWSRGCPYYRG